MKIISWNINSIRAIAKKDFYASVKSMEADIFCLQETKANQEELNQVVKPLKNYHVYGNSAEKKGYAGVALLTKQVPVSIMYDFGSKAYEKQGRVIYADFGNFYLINVYVPNSGQKLERLDYRQKWDHDFLVWLKNLEKTKPLIVGGDFNVAHQAIDLKNDKANYNKTAGFTQIEIDGMTNLLDAGFVDVFRHFNPEKVAYTFWSYRFGAREKNIGWRIDYFLVSKSLIPKVKSIEILSNFYGSDHCPVSMEITN